MRDGAEALEYLFCTGAHAARSIELKPRLVLMDLKLPKVNGLEVLRAIKSDARTRTIPVVVLTSSSEDRDIAEAYQLGVNSYIVKPVDFKQFDEAIRQVGLVLVAAELSSREIRNKSRLSFASGVRENLWNRCCEIRASESSSICTC